MPVEAATIDLWHLGGAVADVDPTETAFWHRDSPHLLNFEANWDDALATEENVAWVRDGIEAARELPGVGGVYGNFPGFDEDPARATFGDNYDRLVDVKDRYDPANLFRLNTNVEPSGGD